VSTAPTRTSETVGQRTDRAFARAVRTIWHLLPRPLRHRIPMSFVGFALINGFTFSIDIGLLALLYRGAGLPHPVAITIGYAVAFGSAFVLNRRFNFHAHGPVAGQVARWAFVVVVNYLALVLGLGSGLHAIGVPFLLARVIAAGAEAIWMYSMMRWWVFASTPAERDKSHRHV
jgi:putative flippase GtrA